MSGLQPPFAAPAPFPPPPPFAAAAVPDHHAWSRRVSFLGNRDTWIDLGKVLAATAVLVTILFVVIGAFAGADIPEFLGILPLIFGIVLVLFLVGVLITALLYGGAYEMDFAVDERGIRWATSRRSGGAARAVLRGAQVIGDLTLNPQLAGSARLAEASETGAIEWRQVRRATPQPGRGAIVIRNSWRVVIRLYCGPTDWAPVLDIIGRHGVAH